jgi:hypothetical protein
VPKIRTTIRPLDELDVSPQEEADLRAQGLLLESSASTDAGLQKAAERKTAADNTVEG